MIPDKIDSGIIRQAVVFRQDPGGKSFCQVCWESSEKVLTVMPRQADFAESELGVCGSDQSCCGVVVWVLMLISSDKDLRVCLVDEND